MTLCMVTYVSQSDVAANADDIAHIERVSFERNPHLDVSGALYYDNETFFQVLEGPRLAVEALISVIRTDRRHHAMAVLADRVISARLFKDWSMKFISGVGDAERKARFEYSALKHSSDVQQTARIFELLAD